MPGLLISPRAILDLIEIWNYIADDSEEYADIFIDKLNEAMEKLRRSPGMGRQREELAPHMRSSRFSAMLFFIVSDTVRTLTRSSEIDQENS